MNNTVAPVVTPPSGTANVTGTWNAGGQPYWILNQTGTTVTGSNVFAAFPQDPSISLSFTGTITGTMSGNTFFGPLSGFESSKYPGNAFLAIRPTGVKVFVRPNQYEPGRANITVFNWDHVGTVNVSVSWPLGKAIATAPESQRTGLTPGFAPPPGVL